MKFKKGQLVVHKNNPNRFTLEIIRFSRSNKSAIVVDGYYGKTWEYVLKNLICYNKYVAKKGKKK